MGDVRLRQPGYTTVVITAIFNAFFVSVIAGGADWATLLWTTVVAISYVIVMIVGPVLGALGPTGARPRSGCWRWPRLAAY